MLPASPALARMRLLQILLLAALFVPAARAQAVLTGTLGATSRDHFRGGLFAYAVGLYFKFDEMVMLGVQGGQGSVGALKSIPITSSAMVRLPIGRVVLPVAVGDVGYAVGERPGFIWRGGGGFDIRNGRRSSFLALGGVEQQGGRTGWFGRGGLLLEF